MHSLDPGLPLLIVIEGENDIRFLKAISKMLHRDNAALPDLAELTSERRAVFLPTGGCRPATSAASRPEEGGA